jgi:oligopeptide transport system substrate-binding protein
VLRPKTASLSGSNLYPLKNGELFNLGKIKVLKGDLPLLAAPRADGAPGKGLPKGTAVRVLATSPMKVATAIAPLADAPAEVKLVSLSKADAKKKTPEQLSFSDGRPAIVAGAGSWKDATVNVLKMGPPVDCNEHAERWLYIEQGDKRGWLPGCALEPAKSDKSFALVARHATLPTFQASTEALPEPGKAAEDPPAEDIGFIDAANLVEDDSVLGVRAVGDHLLEVELERPTPYFTDLTSHPALYPVRKDVVEEFEKRGEPELWVRPENIVCNGPYILDEWKFRYEITMKRNPHYWDRERLKIHRLVIVEVEEYHATMNLYKGGELDFIGDNASLPSEYMKLLETKKDFLRNFHLSTYWYEFNIKKPPVDDVRVRQALNLAVDKTQLVEKITRGGQLPATHFVPDFTGLGYSDQVEADKAAGVDPFAAFVHNPEKARQLLTEAGFEVVKEGEGYRANGFPALEILYNTSEGHKQIAVAIQDMWKRHLGISATLRNEEWKVMLKNVRDGHFQVVRFGWVGDYNHPHTWLDTLMSHSPQNHTGWADKEFDTMLMRAAATPDQKESIKRYREAELRAVEGMAKMPLYFYTKSTLVKPWVRGFTGNARSTHLVKWFWIDPDWKQNEGKYKRGEDYAFPAYEFPTPGRIAPP